MQATIHIGGKDRLVWIDYGIEYAYEVNTGRLLHEDLPDLESGRSIVKMVDLFYTALAVPIQERGGVVDFRPIDVSAWISKEKGVIDKFMKMLNDAFSVQSSDDDEPQDGAQEKKKSAARIGKA